MTRKRRLAANFSVGMYSKSLILARQLAIVPLFISAWGPEYFGEWLLISSIPSFLAMSNLGVGTSAATRAVLALGAQNYREANSLCLTAIVFIALFGGPLLLAVASLALLGFQFPVSSFELLGAPWPVFLILLGSVFPTQLCAPLEAYWIHGQRAAASSMILSTQVAVELVVTAAVVASGGMAFAVSIGILFSKLSCLVLYAVLSFSMVNRGAGATVSFGVLSKLLVSGIGFQLSAVWQAILFQGTLWVAALTLGTTGAAKWGTLRTLCRTGNQVLTLVNQSIAPELQNAIAKDEVGLARELHSAGVMVSIVLSVPMAIALSLFGPMVYEVWTKGMFSVPPFAWWLMSLSLVLHSFWWTSSVVHRASNRPWRINSLGVASAACSAFCMYYLSMAFGVSGLATGLVVFELIMAVFVLQSSLRILGDTLQQFCCRCTGIASSAIRTSKLLSRGKS
ncbi:lipopolysaccharide biosynthesis protein [Rhodopirellula islandica]|nr:hypothetical protein [Rhodopirellula islandica]